METSPPYKETPLPSPTSHSSTITTNTTQPQTHTRPITTRSEPGNPFPTTFVQADPTSFKHVVQMLTRSSEPTKPDPVSKTHHHIPPIKSIPKKQTSGFKLFERRNSMKNFKISPINNPNPVYSGGVLTRKPEILSPSILDFPSLVLSPVTPLLPDPFDRSGHGSNYNSCCFNNNARNSNLSKEIEDREIRERGFFLHTSPATTPRDSEPRLLPLFPVTSPRVSGSSTS